MQARFSRGFVLNLIIIIESALLLVATIWSLIAKVNLLPLLSNVSPACILGGIACGLCLSGSSLAVSYIGKRKGDGISWLKHFNELVYKEMGPLFSESTLLDIVIIAVVSGFCEEILFRGVIQSTLGILTASILFAFGHFAGPKYIVYVFWSFAAGLIFGWLALATGSLWTPVMAHMACNFLSLTVLRYKIAREIE